MISHNYKCIFIHITKCAGTSIETALGHFDGYAWEMYRGGQDHRTIKQIKNGFVNKNDRNPNCQLIVNQQQFNDYFKFTFVRNPWDRLYSVYEYVKTHKNHKKQFNMLPDTTFKEFLKSYIESGRLFFRSQLSYIQDVDGSIPLDFIGRFENLQEDFDIVRQKLGTNKIPHLTHSNKSSNYGYKKKYDEETIELVRDFYKEEIEVFGYNY